MEKPGESPEKGWKSLEKARRKAREVLEKPGEARRSVGASLSSWRSAGEGDDDGKYVGDGHVYGYVIRKMGI
ncbi:MAG: hypothetical protein GY820_26955 [Gammaproteobacteria bacterium]|nr:hypothetical protein [Gammaproteobacteria bacterium]